MISKVFEKVVYDKMSSHLNDQNILYPRQFGFRKGFSTGDAILNLMGEVLKGFDRNLMTLCVFIDLKKAFDTVSHKIILKKLELLGVRGVELDWFQDYLLLRKQYVDVNGSRSPECPLSVSVPRARCLGFCYSRY